MKAAAEGINRLSLLSKYKSEQPSERKHIGAPDMATLKPQQKKSSGKRPFHL